MTYEERSGSLLDDERTIVSIPEADEPETEHIVVLEGPATQPVPWIERREAPWIILGVVGLLVAALLLAVSDPSATVSAAPTTGVRPATTVDATLPIWTALAVPVPESLRTHTVNVAGNVDLLEIADLGPGAALPYTGNVATVDGPLVQQLIGNHFVIASPTGAPVVAFMPYAAGDALILDLDEEVTFVGTLMPVPDDFAAMVGSEAAAIGALTGVYVRVVPETLRTVTAVPETS